MPETGLINYVYRIVVIFRNIFVNGFFFVTTTLLKKIIFLLCFKIYFFILNKLIYFFKAVWDIFNIPFTEPLSLNVVKSLFINKRYTMKVFRVIEIIKKKKI